MTRAPSPSRTAEQFVVRFPDGMRDRIADEAKTNNRSMNAEIVARLQASFEPSANATAVTLEEIIGAFARMMQLAVRVKPGTAADSKTAVELQAVAEKILERLPSGKNDD